MTVSPLVASPTGFTPRADPASGPRKGAPEPIPPRGTTPADSEQSGKPQNPLAAEQAERESSPDGLTAKERRIVAELQRIDRQVRAHEQAHLAAAAGLARGVSFQFATGPDGRRYAVGGEARIDTAPVKDDPQATIRKAQQIRTAANAPANPSAQDRAVAAQASAMEAQARQDLLAEPRQALEQQIRASQTKSFEGSGVDLGAIFNAIG